MTQPLMRAYTVQRELEFIDQYFDEPDREQVKAKIPHDIQEEIRRLSRVDWCPIEYSSAVLHAIASAKHDPKGSFRDIVECGKFVSVEATNTFYKMLLKVVTPAIFFKKTQTIWSKDFKDVGTWEVQMHEGGKSASLSLSGVGGMDHLAPVSEGFLTYVVESMGYGQVSCETHGWSLENPGPESVRFEMHWS